MHLESCFAKVWDLLFREVNLSNFGTIPYAVLCRTIYGIQKHLHMLNRHNQVRVRLWLQKVVGRGTGCNGHFTAGAARLAGMQLTNTHPAGGERGLETNRNTYAKLLLFQLPAGVFAGPFPSLATKWTPPNFAKVVATHISCKIMKILRKFYLKNPLSC